MKKIKISNKGFTLLELLVVVAIIGLLSAVVMVALNSARDKGDDTAVKTNLRTVANQAELFYSENGNSYLPLKGGEEFSLYFCKYEYSLEGTNMFSRDKIISDAIAEATKRGKESYCYNSANTWAVAIGLKGTAGTSWCADSQGVSTQINSDPSLAISEAGICAQPSDGGGPEQLPPPDES